MRTIEYKVYTIDEHPDKESVFNWIRSNWHELNSHSVEEVIDSFKALQSRIGGDFDYCFGQVPDRSEFISFTDYDKVELNKLVADDCPLTGVCWDIDVIKAVRSGNPSDALISLHNDSEYVYSDDGLYEMCEANEYEFCESGKYAG